MNKILAFVVIAFSCHSISAHADADRCDADIKWAPRVLVEHQPITTVNFYEVELTSTRTLTDVALEVTPRLRPYVHVDPSNLGTVTKYVVSTVTLTVDLSSLSKTEKLRGEIRLKARCKEGDGERERHVAARPLHVGIIASPSTSAFADATFYTGVGDPHWASFQTTDGTQVAIGGTRLSDGTPSVFQTIQASAPKAPHNQVLVDAQGRPTSADLSDGTHLVFQWISATKALVVALVDGGQIQTNVAIDFSQISTSKSAATVTAIAQDKSGDTLLHALSNTAHRSRSGLPPQFHQQRLVAELAKAAAAPAPTGSGSGTMEVDVVSSDTGEPISNAFVDACVNGGVAVSFCPPLQETAPGSYTGPFQNNPDAIPPGLVEEKCEALVDVLGTSCQAGGDNYAKEMVEGGCEQLAASVAGINPAAGEAVGLACVAAFAAYDSACTWDASGGLSVAGQAICPALNAVVNTFSPSELTLYATAQKGNLSGHASTTAPATSPLIATTVSLAEPDCQIASFTTDPADPVGDSGTYNATVVLQCAGSPPSLITMQDIGTDGYTQGQSCSMTAECSMTIPDGASGIVDTITVNSSSNKSAAPLGVISLTFQ